MESIFGHGTVCGFYTQTLLHRAVFTHRPPLVHTDNFRQSNFYTEAFTCESFHTGQFFHTDTPFHRAASTARSIYTEKPLHKGSFHTHRSLSTQTLLHRAAVTQRPLHAEVFTQSSFSKAKPLHREAFTRSSFLSAEARSLYTKQLYTQKPSHADAVAQSGFYTEAFTCRSFAQSSFCTKKPLHREAFTQSSFAHRSFYPQKPVQPFTSRALHGGAWSLSQESFYPGQLLHRKAQRSLCTETILHREKPLHRTAFTVFWSTDNFIQSSFTHRSFYTQKFLRTDAFTQSSFYTQTLLHTDTCALAACPHRSLYTQKLKHRAAFSQRPLPTEALTQSSLYAQTRSQGKQDTEGADLRRRKTLVARSDLCWPGSNRLRQGSDWFRQGSDWFRHGFQTGFRMLLDAQKPRLLTYTDLFSTIENPTWTN